MLLWMLGNMYLLESVVWLFFESIPSNGISGTHMIVLFLVFWKISIQFSKDYHTSFNVTSSLWRFAFSTPLPAYAVFILMIVTLTGVRWHLIVALICIFLMINNVEHHLWIFCPSSYHLWGKRSIQVFCLFYSQVVFYVELYELFLYCGYHPLMSHIICKCFIPFSPLSFLFCWFFFAV